MKILVCAIAKMEELYIREWVEWNKKIGVDHIILGDNNDEGYSPSLSSVIEDYIKDGYVEVVDKRGVLGAQRPFYVESYNKYKDDFDWIGFIDIDEFIYLPAFGNNIHNFLEDKRLESYRAVILIWKNFNDSDNLFYEDKPVLERFNHFSSANKAGIKYFIKPTKDFSVLSIHNPFFGKNCDIITACDVCFNMVKGKEKGLTTLPVRSEYYDTGFIKHYITKSTEEYIKYKVLRGRADRKVGKHELRYTKDFYFRYNRLTKEKLDMFHRYKERIQKSQQEEVNKYRQL